MSEKGDVTEPNAKNVFTTVCKRKGKKKKKESRKGHLKCEKKAVKSCKGASSLLLFSRSPKTRRRVSREKEREKRGEGKDRERERERAKKGDGEEEKQEVGKTALEEWREQRVGSSTGRANYKTQLKWYHENALSNIVSTRRV